MKTLAVGEGDRVSPVRAEVGEGPVWDERLQRLYWIDITRGRLFWRDESDGGTHEHEFGSMLGTVALTEDAGTVLVALENGLHDFIPSRRETRYVAHPASGEKGCRYNDGKPDRFGRLWIGSMHPDGQEGRGALYCCQRDGSFQRVLQGLSIPNGLDWSPDGGTFYFVDSPARTLQAFAISGGRAELASEPLVWDLSGHEGVPDGLTVDADGRVWIAFWGGHAVKAFDPVTREYCAVVGTPAAQTASCVFGGAAMDALWITTAGYRLEHPEPGAGYLYRTRTDFRGRCAHRFGGA